VRVYSGVELRDSKEGREVLRPIEYTREITGCLCACGWRYAKAWPLRLVSKYLSCFAAVNDVFRVFEVTAGAGDCGVSVVKPLVVLREVPIRGEYCQEAM
jgi:hypothetical protein